MLFMIFVFLVGFALVAFAIVRLSSGGGGDDKGGGEDGHWWRRRGPRPRGPKPKSPEPTWWPEFEREFRAYVVAQGSARKISGVN